MVFCPQSPSSCEYYNYEYPYTGKKVDERDRSYDYPDKRSLIPKRSGGTPDYYPQQSRDYALSNTIPCDCIVCPANKNKFCETPALISINGKGQCRTGLSFAEPDKPQKDDECRPEPRDKVTPEWFYNRYECNAPLLGSTQLPGFRASNRHVKEDMVEDIIRVNLERIAKLT